MNILQIPNQVEMKNVVKCCKDFNTLETHRTTLSQDISSNFIQKLLNTMCRLFQMILFPNNCAKSLSMKIFVLKKRFMDSHFAHYFGDMTSTKISSCKKAFFTWNEKYFFRMFIKPFWWRSPTSKCTAASGKALPLKITL